MNEAEKLADALDYYLYNHPKCPSEADPECVSANNEGAAGVTPAELTELERFRENDRKRRARAKLMQAIHRGKISKPDFCSRCRSRGKIFAHHPRGYDDPFDVEWLCSMCHAAAHHPNSISAKFAAAQVAATEEGRDPDEEARWHKFLAAPTSISVLRKERNR